MRHITSAAAAAALMMTLAACGSTSSTTAAPEKSTAPSSAAPAASAETGMKPGAYLSKADYTSQMADRKGTKVVYFFHASWCPSCKATDESLMKDGVPAGLTVVKVDYDTMTDLRQQYGVSQQHTFVQIDESGKELMKWSGSKSGAEIKAKTV